MEIRCYRLSNLELALPVALLKHITSVVFAFRHCEFVAIAHFPQNRPDWSEHAPRRKTADKDTKAVWHRRLIQDSVGDDYTCCRPLWLSSGILAKPLTACLTVLRPQSSVCEPRYLHLSTVPPFSDSRYLGKLVYSTSANSSYSRSMSSQLQPRHNFNKRSRSDLSRSATPAPTDSDPEELKTNLPPFLRQPQSGKSVERAGCSRSRLSRAAAAVMPKHET